MSENRVWPDLTSALSLPSPSFLRSFSFVSLTSKEKVVFSDCNCIIFRKMSQSDELLSSDNLSEDEKLNESEEIELAEKVAEAEEEYDPDMPELETVAEKAAAEEDAAEQGAIELGSQDSADKSDEGSEEEDDSIVNDEIEYDHDHDACLSYAKEVDAFLLRTLKPRTLSDAERQAAVADLLCEHFCRE